MGILAFLCFLVDVTADVTVDSSMMKGSRLLRIVMYVMLLVWTAGLSRSAVTRSDTACPHVTHVQHAQRTHTQHMPERIQQPPQNTPTTTTERQQ